MEGYLGTTDVTPTHPMTPNEGALLFVTMYGGIDGSHHKAWVLDQVVRCLKGAPITVDEARWEDGTTELRYSVGTCDEYERYVREYEYGDGDPEEDEQEYEYDTGIAP